MADYIKCELIGGCLCGHFGTFSNLFIVATVTAEENYHTPCCPLQNNQNIPLSAATVSFKDLLTLHRRTPQPIFW